MTLTASTPAKTEIVRTRVGLLPPKPLTFGGRPVITLSMMDKVHGRPDGTAKRNFHEHRDQLVEGEDYFIRRRPDVAEFWRTNFVPQTEARGGGDLVLLTEDGYFLLVKSFQDPLAWDVQRALRKAYFAVRAEPADAHLPWLGRTENQWIYAHMRAVNSAVRRGGLRVRSSRARSSRPR